MKTVCCSYECGRRLECDKHAINNYGTNACHDFYGYGSGAITEDGCEVKYWCGELGNYQLFEPIKT